MKVAILEHAPGRGSDRRPRFGPDVTVLTLNSRNPSRETIARCVRGADLVLCHVSDVNPGSIPLESTADDSLLVKYTDNWLNEPLNIERRADGRQVWRCSHKAVQRHATELAVHRETSGVWKSDILDITASAISFEIHRVAGFLGALGFELESLKGTPDQTTVKEVLDALMRNARGKESPVRSMAGACSDLMKGDSRTPSRLAVWAARAKVSRATQTNSSFENEAGRQWWNTVEETSAEDAAVHQERCTDKLNQLKEIVKKLKPRSAANEARAALSDLRSWCEGLDSFLRMIREELESSGEA